MEIQDKVKRAAHILMLRSHSKPGVRGWELRRALGDEYIKIIDLLDKELSDIGLRVAIKTEKGDEPSSKDDYDDSFFFVTFRSPPDWPEIRGSGWRIDELAALAVSISLIAGRGGKARYEEILDVLTKKIPERRARALITRFIKQGYLSGEDELELGWRTFVEVDVKGLLKTVIGASKQSTY